MFPAILLVSLVTALDLTNASQSDLSLKSLCSGEKVDLRTIRQLDSLVMQSKLDGGECSDAIKTALEQLKELTGDGERDVCTMEQATAITDFVDRHMKDAADGTRKSLPKPLEKFVVAYGMKVSDKSPLGMVLDPLIKPGEVILPVDLMQAIPGLDQQLHLMVPREMGLVRFKYICEQVFQPLYEPLMLPLAHLSRAGFNNREFYWALRHHLKSRFWSRTVFLCEIAKKVEYDSEQGKSILRDEEAALEMKVGGLGKAESYSYERLKELSTVTLEANPKPTGDKILGRFDYSMNSLIKAFDANKDHVQVLRERIMKRGLRVLRSMFKKRGFGKHLKAALAALKVRKGSMQDVEEAKKLLSTLMESPQSDSTAHLWLVKKPLFILDILTSIISIVLVIVPMFFVHEFSEHKTYQRIEDKLDDLYLDYVQFSDLNN